LTQSLCKRMIDGCGDEENPILIVLEEDLKKNTFGA
jgi:hypothetical protein